MAKPTKRQTANLMYRLFQGRRDTYGVQRIRENELIYLRVANKELSPEIYFEHLHGNEVLAIYPLLEGGQYCYFAALDIDRPDYEIAKQAANLLPQPNYIEKSRSGNYHIWMFFETTVSVAILETRCREAIALVRGSGDEHCNLYPLATKGVGLLIALPLQGRLISQGLTIFLDPEGKEITNIHEFLKELRYTRLERGGILDDPVIYDLWLGRGKTHGDCSQSGYDFSFCQALFKLGLPHMEVRKLLRARPQIHSNENDYLTRTVESALESTGGAKTAPKQNVQSWEDIKALNRKEFLETLGKHLVLEAQQVLMLEVFYACLASNLKTKGRPVWLLLIGPPGCGKTLPMIALQHSPFTYIASSFRPSALISGWGLKGSEDMSLIPKLHGKVLLVKDLSSLLSQNKDVVAEVLGLLRDAYDGSCSRPFGTGVVRSYTSRFGFVGASTPDIDAHWALNVRLGERFIRFRVRSTLEQVYEKIDRSLSDLRIEEEVDTDIELASLGFLKHLLRDEELPPLSNPKEIGRLAQLGAILRTPIARGAHGQQVLVLPEWEEATRFAKQLAKMALALAFVREKQTNGVEELETLKALVRDGMDARMEKIAHYIFSHPNCETSEISAYMHLPAYSIRMCLDDLSIARIILGQRNSLTIRWSFVPFIEGQLKHFGLWKGSE